MAPIINTNDERAVKILDAAGVKYNLVQPVQSLVAAVQKPVRGKDYILLDREHQKGNYSQIDLLVPFERSHLNERWTDCTTPQLLAIDRGYMPTIRMYVDFLKLIKSGKSFDGDGRKINPARLRELYEEIAAVRSPWRGEHLDAKFGSGVITYHLIEKDGSARPVTESLGDCLMENKLPGVDINSLLRTANKVGLPTSKTKSGSLYFWHPRENAVAGFDADSDRAVLICGRDPVIRDSALGVRVARKKLE